MSSKRSITLTCAAVLFAAVVSGVPRNAAADITDLSPTPLAQSSTASVLPNLMFILDNSGSMAWDYLPDYVNDAYGASTSGDDNGRARAGDPPYYAAQFNGVAYNPQITYTPGVNADGTSMAAQTNWNAVQVDPYTGSGGTIDITTQIPERVYCKGSWWSGYTCKQNGIDNKDASGEFRYNVVGYPDSTYGTEQTNDTHPFYYTITPVEYCSDAALTTCVSATSATGTYVNPAPVRFCATSDDAQSATSVSGTTTVTTGHGWNKKTQKVVRCQGQYDDDHPYVRYGEFTRTDIVPTQASYGPYPGRTDCDASGCTYTEEMNNYANWYAYYRTRINMMKTAAGTAFKTIGDNYRVGFTTINPTSSVSSSNYLPIGTFDTTQKNSWYSKFYSQVPNGGTPLQAALSRVGQYFAGKQPNGMDDDPVQYSCQQNFSILTTDGFWNGGSSYNGYGSEDLNGNEVGDQDGTDSGYSTRASGAYDGTQTPNTLSDVSLYYYKTDLRPAGSIGALGFDVSENNVPTSTTDTNSAQHMNTFTVGMANGEMIYRSDYQTATSGDFYDIRTGASGCAWSGSGVCNWPEPEPDTLTALDDLWHAAVNGRGIYYNAVNAQALSTGLSGALSEINVQTAAASAAATSSPNVTQTNNFVYSSTFRTVKWDGEVIAQQIDPTSGEVLPTVLWSAQQQLDAATPASRNIYTYSSSSSNHLTSFDYSDLDTTAQGYFSNKCTSLDQCTTLSDAQKAIANDGADLVSYLRGDSTNASTTSPVFRQRDHVLGDTVDATPVFVQAPTFNFNDSVSPTYQEFQQNNASRQAVLYIASNDGMLHAFNATNGQEMWAYAPRTILPNLYKLADANYATKHQFFVDGTPTVSDVYDTTAQKWRTILVGGFNSGGAGYYALDITDPGNPQALWEICNDSTLCANSDPDLGYSYGNPVIGKRASDGRWVVFVTSGYNNVPAADGGVGPATATGHGYLYVLDAITGEVLNKIDDGAGGVASSDCPTGFSAPCPSGLAKISGWVDNFNVDNTIKYIYGGDLMGNLWRFDVTTATPTVLDLATLKDANGKPQSVTAQPDLGNVNGNRVIYLGTGRYLGVTDLSDPSTLTPALPYAYQNTIYGIKDNGAANGNLRTSGNLVQQTITNQSDTSRTISSNAVNWSTQMGFYLDLDPDGTSPGERVVLRPQLNLGTLVVTTDVPNANACTTGGDSWTYQLNYLTGSYISTTTGMQAGYKTTGSLVVGNVIVRLPSGQLKIIQTTASGKKNTLGLNIGGAGLGGKKTGWRMLGN
jgi:type IV pilus assembly protein PilY1